MSAYLSLETCKRLQEAGYPQDQWPQMVWVAGVEDRPWYLTYDGYQKPCIACPPFITADSKGGVFPWFESKGWYFQIMIGADKSSSPFHSQYRAYRKDEEDGYMPEHCIASSGEELSNACLDAMGVPR